MATVVFLTSNFPTFPVDFPKIFFHINLHHDRCTLSFKKKNQEDPISSSRVYPVQRFSFHICIVRLIPIIRDCGIEHLRKKNIGTLTNKVVKIVK